MPAELTISVEGQTPEQAVQPFIDAIATTLDIVRELETSISQRRRAGLRWTIRSLRFGSPATLTMQALPPATGRDLGSEVVRHYLDGLDLLARGVELPAHFTESALEDAKRLARLTQDNAREIVIRADDKAVKITQRIAANVDDLVHRSYVSEGSIEGVMEMITLHEHVYFRVYDAINGWGVPCYFNQETVDDIRIGLGRRVSVRGRLRSDRLGKPMSLQVAEVRLLGDQDLPKPSDIRGIARGMTQGQKSEDYLRELRGDDEFERA